MKIVTGTYVGAVYEYTVYVARRDIMSEPKNKSFN
jgi:hypothetical protein